MEQNSKPRHKPTHFRDKGDKYIQWEKGSLFNNGFGRTGQLHVKK